MDLDSRGTGPLGPLPAADYPLPPSGPSLLAAAIGLAQLAAAHVAESLVADTDVRELTRKDRLALTFAPRLSADAGVSWYVRDRQQATLT